MAVHHDRAQGQQCVFIQESEDRVAPCDGGWGTVCLWVYDWRGRLLGGKLTARFRVTASLRTQPVARSHSPGWTDASQKAC